MNNVHYKVVQDNYARNTFKIVAVKLTKGGWHETNVIRHLEEHKANGIKAILDGRPFYILGGDKEN